MAARPASGRDEAEDTRRARNASLRNVCALAIRRSPREAEAGCARPATAIKLPKESLILLEGHDAR